MILPALAVALLTASSSAMSWHAAVAESIACGTFEPQYHDDDVLCPSGRFCWDENGRPSLSAEQVYDTPGGFFRIHYTFEGLSAISSLDRDANGLPDYVDKVAAAFDDSLEMFRRLGFRDPQPDEHGGNERLDVYLSLAAEFGGVAYWDAHSKNTRPEYPGATPVFIAINPVQHALAYEVLADWAGELLIKQVVLHELHHAVQMGYGYGGDSWVLEGMSVMMEQELLGIPRTFPFVTDFRYSLRYRSPNETLLQNGVTRIGYANGLFYSSLLQDMGGTPAGFANYWDGIGRGNAIYWTTYDLVSAGLLAAGLGTLEEAYRRFSLREIFLGAFDDGRHFKDGYRYNPPDGAVRTQVVTESGEFQTPLLERFGHTFFRIEAPAGTSVGLVKAATPNTEWDWVQQHADCSTSVTAVEPAATYADLPIAAGDTRAWLVVRRTGGFPTAYPFTLTATAGEPAPVNLALEILETPQSVSAGVEFPIIARLTRSDCRLVDVTDTVTWSAEPAAGFALRAGGALRVDEPGTVTISAIYEGAVSSVTLVVAGDPGKKPDSGNNSGCSSGAGASEGLLWLLVFAWLAGRRHALPIPS